MQIHTPDVSINVGMAGLSLLIMKRAMTGIPLMELAVTQHAMGLSQATFVQEAT